MLVLLRPTNLWGYACKGLRARIMKTTSQEKAWIHWVTILLGTNLFLCLKLWKYQMQRQQWMGNLEKIPAWQQTKVKNKNEVIAEARTKGHTVHFASLMDRCHLKYSELEPQVQKCKGRVVLRGDIVKDDSGSYAVFSEPGSSASQMSAAKVMSVISRLTGCAGQAADAVSAYIQVRREDAPPYWRSPDQNVRHLDTSPKTQEA